METGFDPLDWLSRKRVDEAIDSRHYLREGVDGKTLWMGLATMTPILIGN